MDRKPFFCQNSTQSRIKRARRDSVKRWPQIRNGNYSQRLIKLLLDLDPARFKALMDAYQSVRPLSKEEQANWPLMIRAAALRFWISRLWDFYLPRDAQMLTPHDPRHFENILLSRKAIPN